MAVQARRDGAWSTADAIKSYIVEAALRPGDLMPTEDELGQAIGVSRSSVREAIRTLASLDIVEVRHGHGTYVGPMSLAPLVNGLVFRLTVDAAHTLKSMHDVVRTRLALDLALAEEVVAVHRGRQDGELLALVATMRAKRAAGESFMAEDSAFHARLLRDVDNALLGELAGAFWQIHTRALPLLGISPPEDLDVTLDAHGELLRTLAAGDSDAYRAAIRTHYAPLQRAIERTMAARDEPAAPTPRVRAARGSA